MENRERHGEFWNKICQRFLFVPIIIVVVSVLVIGLNWYDKGLWAIGLNSAVLTEPTFGNNTEEEVKDELNTSTVSIDEKNIVKIAEGDEKLDINSATVEELMRLPGIGKVRAFEIVEMREKMGGFRTLEDLMCAEGVGMKTFEGLKEFIEIKQLDTE